MRFVLGYDAVGALIEKAQALHEAEYEELVRKATATFTDRSDETMPADEVVRESNARCNQENLLSQLKTGVRALRAPLNTLESNWAYMVIASLAWTLNAWLALLLPIAPRWARCPRCPRATALNRFCAHRRTRGMPPSTPRGAVFDNSFGTAAGPIEAGTSFALVLDGVPPALVTCQHLFGPAGGLSKAVPSELMSRFVSSVSVQDALGHAINARAGAAVLIPDADASKPGRDLAAFPLEANTALRPFTAGTANRGGRVYLAARLREGAPSGTWLFPAEHLGSDDDGTSMIRFDDPKIHLPGTSGAPVLNEEGEFVGMVVRFSTPSGTTVGTLLDAQTVGAMLRKADWPAPKKTGFLSRLFK